MAGRTITERCAIIEHKFKGKEISATRLYRIYKQNGVKYKSVRIQKQYPPENVNNFDVQR